MLFLYSRRFLDGKFGAWSGERLGLIAAAIYLFNPGTVFNSAVWGQVDSVGALAVLVTLYWLARGWTELAAVGAAVALLIKFQYAFVIPIVAIVGLKRHLFGRSADPERDGRPDRLRVLTSLAAGAGHAGGPDLAVRPLHLGAVAADPRPDRSLHLGRQPLQGPDRQRLQPVAQRLERDGRHHHLGLRRAEPRPEPRARRRRRGLHARLDAGQLAAGRRGPVRHRRR